jgi:hypothetical protein
MLRHKQTTCWNLGGCGHSVPARSRTVCIYNKFNIRFLLASAEIGWVSEGSAGSYAAMLPRTLQRDEHNGTAR